MGLISAFSSDKMARKLVVDELLCFLSNRVDLLDVITLKKLCTETYNSEEIARSKSKMKAIGDELNIELGPRYIERKGTDKDIRNLEDILMMTNKVGKDDFPTFVAADLNKLPPVYLEHTDTQSENMRKECA